MENTEEKYSPINDALSSIEGYLLSITRNTEGGWYELEIGMPKNWVFSGNDEIGCEITSEAENGTLIKVSPKWDDITIDDLITFVVKTIQINNKIKEEELQFQKEIEEFKERLENKAKEHYNKLDELKVISIKRLGGALEGVGAPKPVVESKPETRGRKPKAKLPVEPSTTE